MPPDTSNNSAPTGRPLEVLFLCPWLPWPLNSGGKIRTFNLIEAVRPWARVHLRAVLEPDQGQADVDALAPHCASLKAYPRERAGALMRLTHSKMERWFHSPLLIESVRRELAETRYDVVHVDELLHARILPPPSENGTGSSPPRPPVVQHHHKLDTVFSEHINRNRGLQKHFDAWKLHRLERESAGRHDHHLLCSPGDADILKDRYPRLECSVVPSGYDPAYFHPPDDAPVRDPAHLVFVGSMDYGPNVGALTRFVERVLPTIVERRPDVRLSIVGRNPAPEIQALASERVEVTGGVPDVRPWLSRATAMVVPLIIGGGTRLKIVEAMGMGCPVISSTIGAEGLGLTHGEQLLLADGTEDFAEAVLGLFEDPAGTREMAARARSHVEANLTWSKLAERLASVWRSVSQEAAQAG
ncbi:MAG: glycosyltransferase [Planctomycetota bacterium]|nr:glycosyltransferase [Planctomycetota bacterium]